MITASFILLFLLVFYLLFIIHVMNKIIHTYQLKVNRLEEKLYYLNRHFEAQDRGDFYTPNKKHEANA